MQEDQHRGFVPMSNIVMQTHDISPSPNSAVQINLQLIKQFWFRHPQFIQDINWCRGAKTIKALSINISPSFDDEPPSSVKVSSDDDRQDEPATHKFNDLPP
jgi:hypothetical protein